MKYLFDYWDKIKQSLNSRYIMLFLDFDGTLSPITKTPQKAFIPKETREILKRLITTSKCRVVIVSGRTLNDIKNKVGIKQIIYVGNHGFEIEGPKIKFRTPGLLRYKSYLRQIKSDLNKRLSNIKGVLLEDKGINLAVHYRLVRKDKVPLVKTAFHESVIFYLIKHKIKIKSGKMLLEVRPPMDWNKGKVVLWLLARQRFILNGKNILPIYIGDDTTDEDAFKALKKYLPAGRQGGVTIFVGTPKDSNVQYYLKDTKEVVKFLKQILEIDNRIICQN